MKHLLKYRFLCMTRNRITLFWSALFPILLMTLMGLVIMPTYSYDTFSTIPIAIVHSDSTQQDATLLHVLQDTKQGKTPMFNVKQTSAKQAQQLLKEDKIAAYITDSSTYDIHVKSSGFDQTIVQSFMNVYMQNSNMLTQMIAQGANEKDIQRVFSSTANYIETNNKQNTNPSYVYFYVVLAMSAMFGGYWALNAINDIQANQSQKGARTSVSPMSKPLFLITSLLLNLVFVFVVLCIQLAYIDVAFHIDFGTTTPYILFILLVGDMAGSAFGSFIGCVVHTRRIEAKIGILTSITMLCSFLAGMMVVQLKWLVEHYIPILGVINPVNMITDGLYSLYYYGVGERYYMSILSLVIFSLVGYAISAILLSKKQYTAVGVK